MINKLDNNINDIMNIWLKENIIAHDFIPEEYWVKNYSIVKNEYIPISDTLFMKITAL